VGDAAAELCKRAVVWNPETSKLDGVSAPPKCTASAPGHGYLDVSLGTTPEALRTTPANPLLILLEAKCLAGLLPHPKGKGPREALQPVIADMVLHRQHDNASPVLAPGASAHECHLVLSPPMRDEVMLRLQAFGEETPTPAEQADLRDLDTQARIDDAQLARLAQHAPDTGGGEAQP
jgi:hypothetical protein